MMKTRSASSEVFSLRRDGKLDEAYRLALQLMAGPDVDEWTQKSMAWCLIDLIKMDVKNGVVAQLAHYGRQLDTLTISASDEVLTKQRKSTLALCRPDGQQRSEAIALSKQMRHAEAVGLYRQLCANQPDDHELQTSLAWEIYGHAKVLMEQETVNVGLIKRSLNEYLHLTTERPSNLHSCFLGLATKLAASDDLKILGFVRLWNLDHLRPEDAVRFVTPEGKSYSSLTEKVVLQASKAAVVSASATDAHYVLPYLDATIEKHPDNTWLKLVKARILLALHRHDDAMAFGVTVAKDKIGEYWAWELLGTICAASDPVAEMSCYCKALLCNGDEKFIGKLRVRLAHLLVANDQFGRAKCEIMSVVASKAKEGQRLPEDVANLTAQDWYQRTEPAISNADFYKENTNVAEALLFAALPWMRASLGERFSIERDNGKSSTKRKLFIESAGVSIEVTVPESTFPHRHLPLGAPLQIKGEFDQLKRFRSFVVEPRPDGAFWDALARKVGVVEGINKDKQVVHVLVDRGVSGVIAMKELAGDVDMGDAIAVKFSKYFTKDGERYRIHSGERTDDAPNSAIRKAFNEAVSADNGMGFTGSDIFISPPLMLAHRLADGDQVAGVALWSLNKKRNTWGWKAVKVAKVIA